MAVSELYGSAAQIIRSEAQAGVSSSTRVYFFGSSPKGELGKLYSVTSVSEAAQKLGCVPGDGYSLTEAVIAAFEVAGLGQILCIPVSNDLVYSSEWIGDASKETGVYTYSRLVREDPGTVNILCAPSVTDGKFLSAMLGLCKPQDDIKSYMIYDVAGNRSQIIDGFADPDSISASKLISDGYATAVWGSVRTSGGYSISGAAVRACVQAVSDAEFNAPARVGGNLSLGGIVGVDGRLFGTAKRYPVFPNVDSGLSAGSQSDVEDIFKNPTISSQALSYNLSRVIPMFAKNLDCEQFPAHIVMANGEIRETVVEMTNSASTWSFEPVTNCASGENIVALIGYDKSGDVLKNPVVIQVSATYANAPIDITSAMSGSVTYIAGCSSIAEGLVAMPQSVKVGGVGFLYDGNDVVTEPVKIVYGVSNQPVLEGNVCFALKADDLKAFYAASNAPRSMVIRSDSYDDVIQIRRSDANAMSADGICTVISRYGTYYTWGDHTSAFSNNTVADERDRFENQMRMVQLIANWFILTFGSIIDDGMTLQKRNDIILETQTKLNSLVAVGALIGQPTCTFEPEENPKDGIAMGHFVFNIRVTGSVPVKYLLAKVSYSDSGLSVYNLNV